MQKLYFKNAFISLYYDEALHLGLAVWQGSIKGAEFREAILLCLELIDRFELTRWLADDRKMKAIDPADAKWSQQAFLPQILSGPLVHMARLPSECAENRQAIELMKEKSKGFAGSLTIRDFDNEEEAMEWLLKAVPYTARNNP